MKKITLLLMLFVTSLLTSQNTVSVDASKTWKSYVAAFNVSDGNFAFDFPYDFPKNKSTFSGNVLTMQPNFLIWAENAASWNADWFSASETPNKAVEVSGFVEDNSLAGSDLTFSGNLDSYTIASGYTVKAFIKALDPGNGYATVTNKTFTLTDAVSTFSVSASASELLAGHIIQYGFSVTGLIANPTEESNLGSVVVSNPANSSQTATYDLLESFNGTGLQGGFGDATPVYDADPTDANTQVVKITNTNGANWQGTDVTLTTPYTLTAATQLSMQLDVYSTTAITIAPKAQGGVDGAPNAVTSVSHTGSGWETLTFTFDQTLDNQGPANGDYSDFALHTNWDTSANGYGTPDGRVFYIKNLKGLPITLPEDPAPTDAPTTPPTRDAADVISLFSDAYTDKPNVTFGTDWDEADISDVTAAGNNIKKVSFASGADANFVALDFASSKIDLTSFTHFHIDIWTETETLDKSFNHKFSNHATDKETSAIQFSTRNTSSPSLPNPNPGGWISYDIPLSSWIAAAPNGITLRDNIAQYLITSNLGVVYVDNIYIYKDGSGTGNTGDNASGDIINWTFDEAASINVFNKIADAAADTNAAVNFNETGNGTGALEIIGVNSAGGAGKNYSYRYQNENFDFKGNSEFNISFDVKFVGNYVGAAFHTGIQVPNTTSGAGVKQINKFDLQSQINNSTWSNIEFNVSDNDFNGSNGLFIFDFIIAAGADVNAGGTVLIDNFKISGLTTASVDNNKLLGFSMFPNPAKTQLQISAKETITKADVFNVLGRKVKSFTVNNTSTSLDISELSKGIYLIKYESAGRVGTAKFIKE